MKAHTSMNNETLPSPTNLPADKVPADKALHILDDDLDFGDEKLGTRQEDAKNLIVCSGGCE
jgi:hypothetical protein